MDEKLIVVLECTKKENDQIVILLRGEQWGSKPRPSEPQSDALTN